MQCFYPVRSGTRLVPCGRCAACMVQKHLQWKFRLHQEVLASDMALWITMQYDDEHLPRSNGIPCVCKEHCVKFFHKLRRYIVKHDLKVTFKYFLVSEHGPKTFRPHYHCLLLFKLPEESFERMLELRQTIYEAIKERWYHGHVEEKLFHSGVVKYLTKYIFKPFKDFDPPVPLFRLISKGIGIEYLDTLNKEEVVKNCFKMPEGVLPRYYRDKLFPLTPHLRTENRAIREDIFDKALTIQYAKNKVNFGSFGSEEEMNKRLQEFNKRQKYILKCQMELVERKQKLKFG